MLLDILFRIYRESEDGEMVIMGQILTFFPSLNTSIACNWAKQIHTSLKFGLHL